MVYYNLDHELKTESSTTLYQMNIFISRVHANLYVTMSVGPSIRPSVRNHFSFLGVLS